MCAFSLSLSLSLSLSFSLTLSLSLYVVCIWVVYVFVHTTSVSRRRVCIRMNNCMWSTRSQDLNVCINDVDTRSRVPCSVCRISSETKGPIGADLHFGGAALPLLRRIGRFGFSYFSLAHVMYSFCNCCSGCPSPLQLSLQNPCYQVCQKLPRTSKLRHAMRTAQLLQRSENPPAPLKT